MSSIFSACTGARRAHPVRWLEDGQAKSDRPLTSFTATVIAMIIHSGLSMVGDGRRAWTFRNPTREQRREFGNCPASGTSCTRAGYLDIARPADDEVDLSDHDVQFTAATRTLKLWLSLKGVGAAAFRTAVNHGVDLAEHAGADRVVPAAAQRRQRLRGRHTVRQ